MMKIYLDNCCYNRPFDQQDNPVVRMETQAKLFIQSLVEYGDLSLTHSFVLAYEIAANPSIYKRDNILEFIEKNASEYIGGEKRTEAEAMAAEMARTGIKPVDAAHIACAVMANCDFFITTDRRLLKYASNRIRVINPVEFANIWEDSHE